MRNVNALACDLFMTNPGIEFTHEALEAYTNIQGAGGASAIVRQMRNLGLPIVKIERNKNRAYFLDADVAYVVSREFDDHYAKHEKRVARVSAPQIAIETHANVDLACMSDDYNFDARSRDLVAIPTIATVETTVETAVAEVAIPQKRARRSRAKKIVDTRVLEETE